MCELCALVLNDADFMKIFVRFNANFLGKITLKRMNTKNNAHAKI